MTLSRIVEAKKAEIKRMKAPRRSLKEAISSARGLAVIAEIKKASPSRGVIERTLAPEARFQKYVEGGAVAVSVVT
ncbi:MAG: Indole-3-glycerol phosphate synthase, partial [Thermovirga lienii]